jgi:exosortase
MNGIELSNWRVTHVNARNVLFFALTIVALWMVYFPLRDLLANSTLGEYYSYVLLIPEVSGFLLYMNRKTIWANPGYSYTIGIPLLIIGGLIYSLGWFKGQNLDQSDYSSLMTFSVILFWIGAFVLLYGTQAFRKSTFPLFFLVFMIPIPTLFMEKALVVIQAGSVETANLFFRIMDIPFLREGFEFRLPGISVKVAEECSGFRSALGLLIISFLAGHLFLRTGWRKFVLVLSVFPIAILKNSLRVVTLSLLGVYVDERLMISIHQSGGLVFVIPGLLLLGLVVWGLVKTEAAAQKGDS